MLRRLTHAWEGDMVLSLETVLMLGAVVCGGLFAGAAIHINAVEHPARMEGGPALALTE